MQKVLSILQHNVQWIVLGFALLFLGYVGYTYFVASPSTVKFGTENLDPGKIDKHILETSAAQLQRQMNPNAPAPAFPKVDWASGFGSSMNPTVAFNIQGPVVTPMAVAAVAPATLVELAKPPAPKFEAEAHGRSLVGHADFNFKPDPKNPAAAIPVVSEDVDWVTCTFRISMAGLKQAFDAAKIPADPALRQTTFLKVDLYRREMLPDGTWTKLILIPPLPSSKIRPLPGKLVAPLALPEQLNYKNWAKTSIGGILRPAFYDVAAGKGTAWHDPSAPPPAPPAGPAAPAAPAAPESPATSPATTPPATAPPTTAPPAPQASADFTSSASSCDDPAAPAPAAPAAAEPVAPTPADTAALAGVPGAQPLPGANDPNGQFDPGDNGIADAMVLAHDTTVISGKTYQYFLRYYIMNPAWVGAAGQGVNAVKGVKDTFLIVSPLSQASAPIEIDPRVKFWAQNKQPNRNHPQVKFDVYTDNPNGKKKEVVTVEAGDPIGQSGWSVVDIRSDKSWFVLVSDSNGHVVRRGLAQDADNADHQKLENEIAPPPAGATASQ